MTEALPPRAAAEARAASPLRRALATLVASEPHSAAFGEAFQQLDRQLWPLARSTPPTSWLLGRCPAPAQEAVEGARYRLLKRVLAGQGLGGPGAERAYLKAMIANAGLSLLRRCDVGSCPCGGAPRPAEALAHREVDQQAHPGPLPDAGADDSVMALACVEAVVQQIVAKRRTEADKAAARQAWATLRAREEADHSMDAHVRAQHPALSEAERKTEVARQQKAEARLKRAIAEALIAASTHPEQRPAACCEAEVDALLSRIRVQ